MKNTLALVLAAGLMVAVPAVVASAQPDTRIVVKTADDLPRHTYTIEGKPSEFILTDAPFKAFVAKVKADIEGDLSKYKIEDRTTLQGYYGVLQAIALFEGRHSDAVALNEKVKELEAKESKKLMAGVVSGSMIAARKEAGSDKAKFEAAFRKELHQRVSALPWEVVRESVLSAKGSAEIASRELVIGQLQGGMDPVAAAGNGTLSNDLAWVLVGGRVSMDQIFPLNPMVVEVYTDIINSHKVAVKDIWTERLVTLTPADKGSPVVVAIWDSGTDTAIFSDQVWVNGKEVANGKDDDGNGFVDDVNGIAFDLNSRRIPELLHPLDHLQSDKGLVTSHTKGLMDLRANIDSPEASALKQYIRSLKPEQMNGFFEDLGLFGNYSHGTHVAGIAAEGNPYIRLLPVRITFDFRSIPTETPSIERATAEAKATTDAVAYMRAAGVRVCNMSWGGSRQDIETELEKKGVGKTAEERAELSRKIFKIGRDALESAMKGAPEILFVAAAGNSDNDNQFSELIPSGLNVPNMITVGAVDQGGKPTGFTTFGKNVTLYANGFEVNSYIPGGQKMKFSGTSMAAPNTANLAAKVLALNPMLSTAEVIERIKAGADPMEGYEGRYVINPMKTVETLRH